MWIFSFFFGLIFNLDYLQRIFLSNFFKIFMKLILTVIFLFVYIINEFKYFKHLWLHKYDIIHNIPD